MLLSLIHICVDLLTISEDVLLLSLRIQALHSQSLVALLAGAYIRTGATAGTVEYRNGHGKLHAGHTGHIHNLGAGRGFRSLFLGHDNRTDDSMRADIRAEVTLNTVVRIPNRNVNCDTAFFISRGALREGAVLSAFEMCIRDRYNPAKDSA